MKSFLIVLSLAIILSNANSSDFKTPNGCMADIQKKRNELKKNYFVSLVFDQNIKDARKHAKKEILKKINFEIQSTATMYYKNEISKKNNQIINNKMEKEFTQSIKTTTLELDIDGIEHTEFYCVDDQELFFLSTVSRKEIQNVVHTKLKDLSKKNKEVFSSINNINNILKKVLLYEEIQINYLPYLMILEPSKENSILINKYFKEIIQFSNAYHKFLNNTVFYVDIQYPLNDFYPIEERVDEVRELVIQYLAEHSIHANSILNRNSIKVKTKKDLALITITLKEIEDRNFPDPNAYRGMRILNYYVLEIQLENSFKPKKYNLEKMNSIVIRFPENESQWRLKLKESIREYHQKKDLIKQLGYKVTKNEEHSIL